MRGACSSAASGRLESIAYVMLFGRRGLGWALGALAVLILSVAFVWRCLAGRASPAALPPDDGALWALRREPAVVDEGRAMFLKQCAPCHRIDGGGGVGPNLTDAYWLHGSAPRDVYLVVRDGVPARGMPRLGAFLGERALRAVVAYVLSLRNTNVAAGKAPQGLLAEEANIRRPSGEPGAARPEPSAGQ